MNERFKFRAWDKINDEWVKIPHLSLDVETGMLNGFFDYTEAAKRRYTLEQCTGLRDKNGKLIYELHKMQKNKNRGHAMSKDTVEAGDIRTQKGILFYVAEINDGFVKTLYKRKTYTFSNWSIGDFMRNTQYVGHQSIILLSCGSGVRIAQSAPIRK